MLSMLNLVNQPQQPNMLVSLLPFIVIFVIFYLLLVLPAKKKQKKHQEMIESLKPGAKVITSGGIYGTIMGVKERTFELKVAANVKIEISKTAIAAVLNETQNIEKNK
jgi:preprotein translocase subunit YajC